MSSSPLSKTSIKRAAAEKFRKRRRSLLRKANELSKLTETDVYLVLGRGDRLFIYNSSNDLSWPPQKADLVGSHSSLKGVDAYLTGTILPEASGVHTIT